MKQVDQERAQTKTTPGSDSNTPPTPPDAPGRQMQQGAFLARAWTFLLHVLHAVIQIIHRKRVPELRQMSRVECGLACLAMILSYYGRKTTVSEVRQRYGVGRDGLSALGIVRAARNYGMRVRAISLQQNDLRFVKLPAIVYWEFNHFLIVERWSRKHVHVVDPARGRYRLTHDEFDAGFTGVVITLEPGTAFDRRAAPSRRALRTYVLQYIRQAPTTILQLLGASLLLQLLGLTLPLVTKVVVDQVVPYRMSNVMVILGIGILVLFLTQTVATLMRGWLLVYLQARIDMHMMLGFVEHMLALPYSFFQQRSTGDLLTRLASNTMLRDILSSQLLSALLDGSLVIFYLLILLWQSPPFGALTLVIGLLMVLLLLASNRPIRNLASRQLAAQGKSQGYLAEALAGIATLKGSGAEQRAFERWANLFYDQLNITLRSSYLASTINTIMLALRLLAPLALLWVGATQVLNGSISLGTMVALNALAAAFFTPLGSLVISGQQFQLIGAHLERIADVTEAEPEQMGQAAQQPPPLTGNIRLEHVSFRYAPDTPEVLHHLDLTVRAEQKVAIVGPSGSGKSTLGKLLLGLYNPTEGAILYDGLPLQQLNYQEVRRQFGVVLQDATLFSGSVLSNITLNNPAIDKEQVMEAAEIAAIHEDIMDMPMGYETFVSEGGSALSGGQRQRLAIARAIAHKPALLLLDEATSHLDVATEERVARHLQALACTQIIIAHRLSTIRDADVILVLDRGAIVEQGSHDELLQRHGYYARLMQHQMEHGTPENELADLKATPLMQAAIESRMAAVGAKLAPPETSQETSSPSSGAGKSSQQFATDTVSNNEQKPAPSASASSQDISLAHQAPSQVAAPLTGASRGLKKRRVLVSGLLALLLMVGLGTGLSLLIHAESRPTQVTVIVPSASPTVVPSVTSTPETSLYPPLAVSYAGTVSDLMTGQHTALFLRGIQQSQGNIQGSFQGLGLVGSFTGRVMASGQVQLTVEIYAKSMTLAFDGNIKIGGDIVGTFSVVDRQGQHTGEAGIWNISPTQ